MSNHRPLLLFSLSASKEDDDKLAFIVILFCFCAPKEDNNQHWLVILLFCFHAPNKDDDKPMFVIIFFCFVSMHIEKMMTSWPSSSLFSFYVDSIKDDNEPARLVVIFSSFDGL
jgi:hypothetical protein